MKYYKGYYPNNTPEYYVMVSNEEWYYFSMIRRVWSKPVAYSGNWEEWICGRPKIEEASLLEVIVVCGCLFTSR